MKYTRDLWLERIWARSDISSFLTHLTRGREDDNKSDLDVLFEILKDRKIKGSSNSGFISGNNTAVCFQDAPLTGIAQNIRHEVINRKKLGGKRRYSATGLIFKKPHIFKKGGRPVIYETKEFINKLPKEERWRMVSLDLNDSDRIVDWTHEREWRIKGDFEFKYEDALIVLDDTDSYKRFVEEINSDDLKKFRGIVVLSAILN